VQKMYTIGQACNAHTLKEGLVWLSNTHQQVKFTAVTKAVKQGAGLIHVRIPATGFRHPKGSRVAKTDAKTDP
jgi:hypothetical protein